MWGGLRALLVDDNQTNLRVLDVMMGRWGTLNTCVQSGPAALEVLRSGERFDVIVLDAHMPQMDGFATAAGIFGLPQAAGVPVIMLSSGAVKGDAERCQSMGIAGYFPKPVSAGDLLRALQRVLAPRPAAGPAAPATGPHASLVTRHSLREEGGRLELLLVEDHPVNQKLVVSLFERWGHRVTVANNGEEGVAAFTTGRFDVVFMDMQMPVMDGLEATRQIRALEQREQRQRTPVVAMTANVMQGDREACFDAGMDDYLGKPVKAGDLLKMLAAYGAGSAVPAAQPGATA